MSRIHRSKHDVTILKGAFPKEFTEPFMELFNMKEENKNQRTSRVQQKWNIWICLTWMAQKMRFGPL